MQAIKRKLNSENMNYENTILRETFSNEIKMQIFTIQKWLANDNLISSPNPTPNNAMQAFKRVEGSEEFCCKYVLSVFYFHLE